MNQPFRSRKEIIENYQRNILTHEAIILKCKKVKRIFSLARLFTVLAAFMICWQFWPETKIILPTLFLFGILFVYLVFRDTDQTSAIKNHELLIRVNKQETDTMQQTLDGYDDGHLYVDPVHAYASDLDLFGGSSLFQWLSRCHAEQSKKLLAAGLKKALSPDLIKKKQEAAKELAGRQFYCQQLQATGMAYPLTAETENKLNQCIHAPAVGFQHPFWKSFSFFYPLIPIAITTLYFTGSLPERVFLSCSAAFYFTSVLISRKTSKGLEMLLKLEPEIEGLQKQFKQFESGDFKSEYLQSLQERLKPTGYPSGLAAISEFVSILKRIDWRSNLLVNLFLQMFFVWDLRLILSLEEWKQKNRLHFDDWFNVIAEMEVLISLASMIHNEPDWCFPKIDTAYFHFKCSEIGHPLIAPETRITNDFELKGVGQISLITGSNMAGKSTFLRSLGINTVLAGMGAPVCASDMSMSEATLISSMRVADNLAENTSTFYAELKKLQFIIDSVNRKEPVFILLDEVLRGTNSSDRHKGSRALIRQLLKSGSVAVMATHDTELAHSEARADESVTNYYFEGSIKQDELYFDYKIKKGICESLNATTLMKKIGIHFED